MSECSFKRGQRICVRESANGFLRDDWQERIFLTYISGADYPYICVSGNDESEFENGMVFLTCEWKEAKPIEEEEENPSLKDVGIPENMLPFFKKIFEKDFFLPGLLQNATIPNVFCVHCCKKLNVSYVNFEPVSYSYENFIGKFGVDTQCSCVAKEWKEAKPIETQEEEKEKEAGVLDEFLEQFGPGKIAELSNATQWPVFIAKMGNRLYNLSKRVEELEKSHLK